jgi:hypothetical protein
MKLDYFEIAHAQDVFLKGYAMYVSHYQADTEAAKGATGLRNELLRDVASRANALIERSPEMHAKESDKDEIADKYEARGREKPRWKARADGLYGADDVRKTFDALSAAGVIPPPDKDFVFVSASSNLPTHERLIFDADQQTRRGKVRFIAGDISEIEAPADLKSVTTKTGSFQFFRWDAERLPVAPASVDLVWDRKGWLWHNATTFQKPARWLASLMAYAATLKPGGAVVIDHPPGWTELKRHDYGSIGALDEPGVREAAERASKATGKTVAPQFEPSTVDQVDRMAWETGTNVWQLVAQHFEIIDVGEGASRMRILKKK